MAFPVPPYLPQYFLRAKVTRDAKQCTVSHSENCVAPGAIVPSAQKLRSASAGKVGQVTPISRHGLVERVPLVKSILPVWVNNWVESVRVESDKSGLGDLFNQVDYFSQWLGCVVLVELTASSGQFGRTKIVGSVG